MSYTPESRLEKLICGISTTAKTRIEKAVETFMNGRFYHVSPTIGKNGEEQSTMTFSETAEELYEAHASGKTIIIAAESDGYTLEVIPHIICLKLQHNEDIAYTFRMESQEGTTFYLENALPDDPVVLTEIST